jgi:hypothetical protein
LLLLWIVIIYIGNYTPTTKERENIQFNGEKYGVILNYIKSVQSSDQCVGIGIKRKDNTQSTIRFDAKFDNNGKEYTKNNFNVSFEKKYILIDLINNSGILCGSYKFYYDQLDKIK